jgi:hypothetical protein
VRGHPLQSFLPHTEALCSTCTCSSSSHAYVCDLTIKHQYNHFKLLFLNLAIFSSLLLSSLTAHLTSSWSSISISDPIPSIPHLAGLLLAGQPSLYHLYHSPPFTLDCIINPHHKGTAVGTSPVYSTPSQASLSLHQLSPCIKLCIAKLQLNASESSRRPSTGYQEVVDFLADHLSHTGIGTSPRSTSYICLADSCRC